MKMCRRSSRKWIYGVNRIYYVRSNETCPTRTIHITHTHNHEIHTIDSTIYLWRRKVIVFVAIFCCSYSLVRSFAHSFYWLLCWNYAKHCWAKIPRKFSFCHEIKSTLIKWRQRWHTCEYCSTTPPPPPPPPTTKEAEAVQEIYVYSK